MRDPQPPRTARPLETLAIGLAVLGVAEFLTGMALAREYVAARGHTSLTAMLTRGGFSEFLAAFHLWGSHTMLAGGVVLLGGLLVTGAYDRERRGLWWSALAFVAFAHLLQVSGNILPLDRHAVQTTVIEGSIVGRVPVIGPWLSERLLAGPSFGEATVALWYGVHRYVLPILLLGAAVGLVRTRGRGTLAFAVVLPLSVALLMAFAVGAPVGEPATPLDANGFDALPGWYVWPMHGAMKALDSFAPGWGWLGAFVLPGLVGGALFLMPFGADRLPRRVVLGGIGALGLVLVVAGAIFGGRPASLIADEMASVESTVTGRPEATRPELAALGEALFRSRGCTRCHGIDGGRGSGGPDLTFVHRKHPDADWYRRFVRNPRSVRPNSTMPAFKLADEDLSALAEFLRRPRPDQPPTP